MLSVGMPDKNMMPIEAEQAQMWVLPGRRTVRLQVPELPVAGAAEPLRVHMDFDAGVVDQIIERLTILRAQMLPRPPAAKKRH